MTRLRLPPWLSAVLFLTAAFAAGLIYLLVTQPVSTAENIAKLIYDYAVSQGLQVSEVRLWETPTSFAVYRTR